MVCAVALQTWSGLLTCAVSWRSSTHFCHLLADLYDVTFRWSLWRDKTNETLKSSTPNAGHGHRDNVPPVCIPCDTQRRWRARSSPDPPSLPTFWKCLRKASETTATSVWLLLLTVFTGYMRQCGDDLSCYRKPNTGLKMIIVPLPVRPLSHLGVWSWCRSRDHSRGQTQCSLSFPDAL